MDRAWRVYDIMERAIVQQHGVYDLMRGEMIPLQIPMLRISHLAVWLSLDI